MFHYFAVIAETKQRAARFFISVMFHLLLQQDNLIPRVTALSLGKRFASNSVIYVKVHIIISATRVFFPISFK